MLQNVQSVASQAGALLDNPDNSIYTIAYLRPHIDRCWAVLDTELEKCGMRYVENIVEFDVPAMTIDLAPQMEEGQPLADMKVARNVWWKRLGQTPAAYQMAARVGELSNPDGLQGVTQWRNARGAIQINASIIDVTVKVAYDQESTTVYDPAQGVVRGTAHILAARVAAAVCGVRPGMATRRVDLQKEAAAHWNAFKSVLVMQKQGEAVVPQRLHPTRRGNASPYVPAPAPPSPDDM